MNKVRLYVIVSLLASLSLLTGISIVYPNIDDLWVENPFWNGLSTFYQSLHPTRMKDYEVIDTLLAPDNSTLFIIGPSKEFTEAEVESIINYLVKGGTIVLADDFGTGNQLLESLGLNPRFRGSLLRDPVFHEKNSLMPKIVTSSVSGVSSVVLNYATFLDVEERYVVLRSSPLSYSVDKMDETPIEFVSFPVLAKISEQGGTIILISDSSLFINSMINRGDNKLLLLSMSRGDVIIDEAHSSSSMLSRIKFVIDATYNSLNYYEIRYAVCIIGSLMILWLRIKVEDTPGDDVDIVLEEHPEYDSKLVRWLWNERRKVNGKP